MFLRCLAAAAAAAVPVIPLADALLTAGSNAYTATKAGLIISTAGNNKSVTFAPPGDQSITAADIAELIEELITLEEQCAAALVAAGVESPTDEQILLEMLNRLDTVTRLGASSFVSLRLAGA